MSARPVFHREKSHDLWVDKRRKKEIKSAAHLSPTSDNLAKITNTCKYTLFILGKVLFLIKICYRHNRVV